jgi:hypothetical protein
MPVPVTKQNQSQDPVIIELWYDPGTCQIVIRPSKVEVHRGDRIQWRSRGHEHFGRFSGVAPIEATEWQSSGLCSRMYTIRGGAEVGKEYKYSVGIDTDGTKHIVDPVIVVLPDEGPRRRAYKAKPARRPPEIIQIWYDQGTFQMRVDKPEVFRKPGEMIQWRSRDHEHLGRFSGVTPIDESEWHSSGLCSRMYTIREDAERGKEYKYSVEIETGGTKHILDPVIVVEPDAGPR